MIVSLEELEFYAYHGAYSQERELGNRYSVSLSVGIDGEPAGESDALADTVDYGKLYQLIASRMARPAKLLEHLAYQMAHQVLAEHPLVEWVEMRVSKHNPPLGGVCPRATALYRAERNYVN